MANPHSQVMDNYHNSRHGSTTRFPYRQSSNITDYLIKLLQGRERLQNPKQSVIDWLDDKGITDEDLVDRVMRETSPHLGRIVFYSKDRELYSRKVGDRAHNVISMINGETHPLTREYFVENFEIREEY